MGVANYERNPVYHSCTHLPHSLADGVRALQGGRWEDGEMEVT